MVRDITWAIRVILGFWNDGKHDTTIRDAEVAPSVVRSALHMALTGGMLRAMRDPEPCPGKAEAGLADWLELTPSGVELVGKLGLDPGYDTGVESGGVAFEWSPRLGK